MHRSRLTAVNPVFRDRYQDLATGPVAALRNGSMQQVIRFVRTRLCAPARSGITNLGAPHRDFGSPKSFSLTRTVGKAASSIGVAIVGSAQGGSYGVGVSFLLEIASMPF